jgi:hypothetical protein
VVQLNLRLSTLLQVTLQKLVCTIEYAQWIFGVSLFNNMLDDVTLWLIQGYKS